MVLIILDSLMDYFFNFFKDVNKLLIEIVLINDGAELATQIHAPSYVIIRDT